MHRPDSGVGTRETAGLTTDSDHVTSSPTCVGRHVTDHLPRTYRRWLRKSCQNAAKASPATGSDAVLFRVLWRRLCRQGEAEGGGRSSLRRGPRQRRRSRPEKVVPSSSFFFVFLSLRSVAYALIGKRFRFVVNLRWIEMWAFGDEMQMVDFGVYIETMGFILLYMYLQLLLIPNWWCFICRCTFGLVGGVCSGDLPIPL